MKPCLFLALLGSLLAAQSAFAARGIDLCLGFEAQALLDPENQRAEEVYFAKLGQLGFIRGPQDVVQLTPEESKALTRASLVQFARQVFRDGACSSYKACLAYAVKSLEEKFPFSTNIVAIRKGVLRQGNLPAGRTPLREALAGGGRVMVRRQSSVTPQDPSKMGPFDTIRMSREDVVHPLPFEANANTEDALTRATLTKAIGGLDNASEIGITWLAQNLSRTDADSFYISLVKQALEIEPRYSRTKIFATAPVDEVVNGPNGPEYRSKRERLWEGWGLKREGILTYKNGLRVILLSATPETLRTKLDEKTVKATRRFLAGRAAKQGQPRVPVAQASGTRRIFSQTVDGVNVELKSSDAGGTRHIEISGRKAQTRVGVLGERFLGHPVAEFFASAKLPDGTEIEHRVTAPILNGTAQFRRLGIHAIQRDTSPYNLGVNVFSTEATVTTFEPEVTRNGYEPSRRVERGIDIFEETLSAGVHGRLILPGLFDESAIPYSQLQADPRFRSYVRVRKPGGQWVEAQVDPEQVRAVFLPFRQGGPWSQKDLARVMRFGVSGRPRDAGANRPFDPTHGIEDIRELFDSQPEWEPWLRYWGYR